MKKNKKMFAILTLVAFMMTLVPALAFASETITDSGSASKAVTVAAGTTSGTKLTADVAANGDIAKLYEITGTDNSTDITVTAVKELGSVTTSGSTTATFDNVAIAADKYYAVISKASAGMPLLAAGDTVTLANAVTKAKVDAKGTVTAKLTNLDGGVATYEVTVTGAAVSGKLDVKVNVAADTVATGSVTVAAGTGTTSVNVNQTGEEQALVFTVGTITDTAEVDLIANAGTALQDATVAAYKNMKDNSAASGFATFKTAQEASALKASTDDGITAQDVAIAAELVKYDAAYAQNTYAAVDAYNAFAAGPQTPASWKTFKDAYAEILPATFKIMTNETKANAAAKIYTAADAATAATYIPGSSEDPGTGDVSGVGNKVAKAASGVYVKTSTADANDSDVLEFEVDLYGTNGKAAADLNGAKLYIWAERSSNVISDIDTITVTSSNAKVTTNPRVGSVEVTEVPSNGVVKFTVKSSQAGKVTVKASLDAADLNPEKNLLSANGSVTGEFNALSTSANKVVFSVDGATSGNGLTKATAYKGAKANSIDKYVVTATITNKAGQPVKEQKVTVSANKSGIELEKEEIKTDNRGKVEFDVTATKSGDFVVTVAAGNASGDLYLNFSATTATNVEITKAPKTTVAVDSEVTFKVAAKDVYGNRFTSSNAFASGSTVAKLGDKEYNMSFDGTDSNSDHKFLFTPSKVGTYEVTFKLPNGKKATTTLEVAEQGKITEMQVNYDANTVNLGATTNEPEVVQVDAAGVTKTTKSANIKYAINGKGVLNFNSNTGVIAVSTDDKYIGETLTVTAVDKTNAISAVATLTIAADAQSLSFNGTAGVTGQDANIPFSVVDVNGNKVALGNNVTINTTAVVTSKPDGANATAVVNKEGELKDKGVAILQVNSNKDGEVKVQVMIEAEYPEINGVAAHTEYYTGTATVTFGDKAVEGATSTATMIMGSTTFVANGKVVTSDVAPFVKDGRTFLPIRALGEALGAEVSFDEATNVVTIKLDGKTVTMTLGSAVMTVGDKVVTMDTAAYATAEGRTVVPVRFAAEALGFNVEAVYATDGTTSAVNFSK